MGTVSNGPHVHPTWSVSGDYRPDAAESSVASVAWAAGHACMPQLYLIRLIRFDFFFRFRGLPHLLVGWCSAAIVDCIPQWSAPTAASPLRISDQPTRTRKRLERRVMGAELRLGAAACHACTWAMPSWQPPSRAQNTVGVSPPTLRASP